MNRPIISDEFCSRNPITVPTLKNSLPDPNITVFWVHRFVKCICSNCVFFSLPVEFLLAFALLFPRKPFHPCRPSQVRHWNYTVNYWPSSKSSVEFLYFPFENMFLNMYGLLYPRKKNVLLIRAPHEYFI